MSAENASNFIIGRFEFACGNNRQSRRNGGQYPPDSILQGLFNRGTDVADDADGYVELAVAWANRLNELSAIRSQMREQVRQSPLCDARQFTNDLVTLLRRAWDSKFAESGVPG
jgi:hypothetical protein